MFPLAWASWPAAIAGSLVLTVGSLALVTYRLVAPLARRYGWTPWFAVVAGACLLALLEPVYDTFSFGQVNLVLLALVLADVWLLARGSRLAGVGVGLAAAVKLTPAIFVLYLLVARRWRAALVAVGTAGAGTLLAALAAPETSRAFWTGALWDTERIGRLSYISNQSLLGMLARLDPLGLNGLGLNGLGLNGLGLNGLGLNGLGRLLWLFAAAGVLAVWAYRVRRVVPGDHVSGVALTGAAGCLISPVTWVHHLVWLIPALVLLVDHGLRAGPGSPRRRTLLGAAGLAHVLLCSSLVFLWRFDASGVDGFLGGSAYVWISLALLLGLPTGPAPAPALTEGSPDTNLSDVGSPRTNRRAGLPSD